MYVVGYKSNTVVVISPDGQRHRQLLSSKDGLVNPTVLDYDKATNRLLVVNESESGFLFEVTRREQRNSKTLDTFFSTVGFTIPSLEDNNCL
jgi:DNA-binding beta-propeller fold protein YncE